MLFSGKEQRLFLLTAGEIIPELMKIRLRRLITDKTKAIVPVHYAGVACDMDRIMDIAEKHRLFVIEDAALAFDSFYRTKPLGGIGHLGMSVISSV